MKRERVSGWVSELRKRRGAGIVSWNSRGWPGISLSFFPPSPRYLCCTHDISTFPTVTDCLDVLVILPDYIPSRLLGNRNETNRNETRAFWGSLIRSLDCAWFMSCHVWRYDDAFGYFSRGQHCTAPVDNEEGLETKLNWNIRSKKLSIATDIYAAYHNSAYFLDFPLWPI